MKPLNKTATKIFNQLISMLGEEQHLKIDNTDDVFMPVVLEYLYDTILLETPAKVFSIAHYYFENGDSIADPDVEFIRLTNNPDLVYPMTITQPLGYRASLYKKNDKWMINKYEQADLASFCGLWLKNIYEQQELKSNTQKQLPEIKADLEEVKKFVNAVDAGDIKLKKCFPDGTFNKKSQ